MADLATSPRLLRVTDDTTPEELAEALGHLCAFAKRQQCIIGTPEHPSAWDLAHLKLDGPLDDWLAKAHAHAS